MTSLDDTAALFLKLARYATARDRATENEPRTITITDDEALLILQFVQAFDHSLELP